MKIYLAGQITPTPKWFYKMFPFLWKREYDKNCLKFYKKATELRDLGLEVWSPLESEPEDMSWEYYLTDDLIKGYEEFKPDALYLQRGWRKSNGAKLEKKWFELHNLPIIYEA